MKFILLSRIIFIVFISSCLNQFLLDPDNSYYYEEKYFRILSNNYDSIEPGNFWKKIEMSGSTIGVGFEAKRDFGSLILLKDWSMYNFKLTKIIFRNHCSFNYTIENGQKCSAEMLLYHTKDNGYYPPGRRIFIRQNFFVIVVPFVKADDANPSNDLLFKFLNLKKYSEGGNNVTPEKPVKLYQIIQNQPSYLFEGKIDEKESLFMVFTQYHFISSSELDYLTKVSSSSINNIDIIDYEQKEKIYRNMKNAEKLKPKVSLMVYSQANYLKSILLFFIFFLI
mgnify:CR=1 FL=1